MPKEFFFFSKSHAHCSAYTAVSTCIRLHVLFCFVLFCLNRKQTIPCASLGVHVLNKLRSAESQCNLSLLDKLEHKKLLWFHFSIFFLHIALNDPWLWLNWKFNVLAFSMPEDLYFSWFLFMFQFYFIIFLGKTHFRGLYQLLYNEIQISGKPEFLCSLKPDRTSNVSAHLLGARLFTFLYLSRKEI